MKFKFSVDFLGGKFCIWKFEHLNLNVWNKVSIFSSFIVFESPRCLLRRFVLRIVSSLAFPTNPCLSIYLNRCWIQKFGIFEKKKKKNSWKITNELVLSHYSSLSFIVPVWTLSWFLCKTGKPFNSKNLVSR